MAKHKVTKPAEPSPLRMMETEMAESNDTGGDVTGIVWQTLENARDRSEMTRPAYVTFANQALNLLAEWTGPENAIWLAEKLGLDADLTETNALYLGIAERF